MSRLGNLAVLCNVVLSLALSSLAQTDPSAGILPFSVNTGGQFDSLDPATGNIMLTIPVVSKAGKIPFSFNLVGNFHIYTNAPSCPSCWDWVLPLPGAGGSGGGLTGLPTSGLNSKLYFSTSYSTCNGSNSEITISNFSLVDPTGASHPFINRSVTYGPCGNSGAGAGPSSDSSGYTLNITGYNPPQYTVYDRSGNRLGLTATTSLYQTVTTVTDPDNVAMSVASQTTNGVGVYTYKDTLGLTALIATVSLNRYGAGNSAPDTYSYYDANGSPHHVTVNYTGFTLRTNFGCTSPADVNFGLYNFPTSVVLDDGETFSISYEATRGYSGSITGRLNKLTFPGGGFVTYTYSGGTNGVRCGGFFNQSPVITRQINDAKGHTSTWTYTASTPDQYANFTVTAKDPLNDTTTYHFYNTFPTETVVSDVNSGVLTTAVYCYNGQTTSKSACIAPQATYAIVGVKQTDVYTSLGSSPPSLVETLYDGAGMQYTASYGDVIGIKRYGVGATYPPSGSPVSTRTITYANVNGTNCGITQTFIHDKPCGNTTTSTAGTLSATNYTYNGTGHPTQTGELVTGSTYLYAHATYNPNGTIATSTDVNAGQTFYYYNGAGGCNNLLLTSTLLPVDGLSSSQTWNCYGAVVTSSTDFNGNVTQFGYLDQNGIPDPLWRLRSTTDAASNVTWINYSAAGVLPPTTESVMTFNNGAAAVDTLTTFDGLGRNILQQTRQAPGSANFDTVGTSYDLLGRVASTGMPCVSTASVACSSAATMGTYDAINRALKITDAGGGYTQYTYTPGSTSLDVMVTQGPAPTGENLKKRQLEYDGLSRLTSVCELTTSANGGGNCAQNAAQTGYWTKYTYDGLDRLTGVTQNAQGTSQSRSYVYDALSRMTSETNPESGHTTYVYDSSATPCNGGAAYTSNGDLIMATDATGKCAMYFYDKLHRVTDVGNNQQSATNPCRRFRYDNQPGYSGSTRPSGLANTMGKLIEAATDSCVSVSNDTLITDEWFSYGPRGHASDLYESTPNSGGYYHSQRLLGPNYALTTLGLFNNSGAALFPTLTYNVDGEGRSTTVSAATGQNPATSVTYVTSNGTGTGPAGALTGVTFGSNDSDAFIFDPNTGRMTKYTLTLNGQSDVGNLTWNANATLQQLAITNAFYPLESQTCNNTYDDLGRLHTNSCGSTWSQTFNYDPFGNISKSGSISWNPGYSSSNNHYTLAGTSYDSSGRLLNDTFNTYTWDVYGDLSSVDGTTVTYDAFGRMVEIPSYGPTQFVYSPGGGPAIAYMIGQMLGMAYAPLPGGSSAIFQTSGLSYYAHPDWLGSTRALSTPTRNRMPVMSYAPFGEGYNPGAGAQIYEMFTPGGYAWTEYDGKNQTNTVIDFMFRRYSPVQGRWISPDPAGSQAVDPSNPQSWNRYAYALNNPLSNIDPSGLECVWDDGSYDSAADPGTGNYAACTDAGGVWIEPGYFQTLHAADWSSDANNELQKLYNAVDWAENPDITVMASPFAANNGSWTWNFTKSFFGNFSLPNFGSGSCLSVAASGFTSAARAAQSASSSVQKYAPALVQAANPGNASAVSGALYFTANAAQQMGAPAKDIAAYTIAAGAVTTAASSFSALGQSALSAARNPYVVAFAAEATAAYGVYKEAVAAYHGQCTF